MKKVLILCTGNSCRSIMAEALINNYLKDQWVAFSAGTEPSIVNPRAIQVLQEIGIDTSEYYSKSVREFIERDDLDMVITVCDHAKESCPIFLRPIDQIHIGFEDPAPFTNAPDDEALLVFRKVRDEIKERLLSSLGSYH